MFVSQKEAGELIAANVPDTSLVEIGELFTANQDAQFTWTPNEALVSKVRASGDVTIFKSVGVGVQDVAIASAVVDRAQADGVGTVLQL